MSEEKDLSDAVLDILSEVIGLDPNVRQKELLPNLLKNDEFYILFSCNEAGNTDDINYELDYMFRGIYLSRRDAFCEFLKLRIEVLADEYKWNTRGGRANKEIINKYEDICDGFDNYEEAELDSILVKENWKIMSSKIN